MKTKTIKKKTGEKKAARPKPIKKPAVKRPRKRAPKKPSPTPEPANPLWGPIPAETYGTNMISLVAQSPFKAYAFWEWSGDKCELGLLLRNILKGETRLLASHLSAVGEYWIDSEPDQKYSVELVRWAKTGKLETLIRSRPVQMPRNTLSRRTRAVFIDTRAKRVLPEVHLPKRKRLECDAAALKGILDSNQSSRSLRK